MRHTPAPDHRRSRGAVTIAVALAASTLLIAPTAAVANGGHPTTFAALPVRGADLSFAVQEQAAGNRFLDNGAAEPVEQIFADHGANYSRIRVWVNPWAGYSSEAVALEEGRRAAQAGMHILLDPHYSDSWADPAHQSTPAAWAGQSAAQLQQTVHDYTRKLVHDFAAQHTPVSMIEIGNEITNGMLWPTGAVSDWPTFAGLLKAGIAGAHAGAPHPDQLQVMIHIDRGGDNAVSRWFYDNLAAQGVDYDVIGLSYYPFWHGGLTVMQANIDDLAVRYDKDVVIVETAYPSTLVDRDSEPNWVSSASQLPDGAVYPATPAGQAGYYTALRAIVAGVPDHHGLGIFAWAPDWAPGVGWQPGSGDPADNLTMFDPTGNAYDATLDALYSAGHRR